MPSHRPKKPTVSETPEAVHRLEDLLAQLEDNGLKRNGHDDLLKKAADAETYYQDNDLAIDVLRSKYLAPGETGPLQMWDRIARAMASVETDNELWYDRFFSLLMDFKFIPGGRVMHGAGREEARRKPTLSNCYVVPSRTTASNASIGVSPNPPWSIAPVAAWAQTCRFSGPRALR